MNGSLWVASYVVLWLAVVVLGIAVVALLRQIGVLHARIAPMGTLFAGEGPEVGSAAPGVGIDWDRVPITLLAFTSPTCVVCHELRPSLRALARQDSSVRVEVIELGDETKAVFDAFSVRSTPYMVTVDRGGQVRGRGVANTMEQIEELIRESILEVEDRSFESGHTTV